MYHDLDDRISLRHIKYASIVKMLTLIARQVFRSNKGYRRALVEQTIKAWIDKDILFYEAHWEELFKAIEAFLDKGEQILEE